jgi:hypothetical protein
VVSHGTTTLCDKRKKSGGGGGGGSGAASTWRRGRGPSRRMLGKGRGVRCWQGCGHGGGDDWSGTHHMKQGKTGVPGLIGRYRPASVCRSERDNDVL